MNMEIVDAYKAAASGLKVTRQENGVSIDSVEDAIEQFESEVRVASVMLTRNYYQRWYFL